MRSSVGRGYAPDGSCGIEMHVGGVAPTYSTESPSTFCHPLGSSPPRLARAPMYWSRSLNDSDIVRAPDFTDSVPPGDTAAIATTCSRSEEHTSELQSLMRISYAVFCLKKKKQQTN